MLPTTPYGAGVREIKAPTPLDVSGFEGCLVRNPDDPAEWGILYKQHATPERSRFTVAHELGHFVLHRALQSRFECDNRGVTSGQFDGRNIEREANEFASNLLMPLDLLRRLLGDQRKVTLHLLSDIARTFEVSFEALCLRFIEATDQRAILIHWDQGFLKYQRASRNARMTRARVRQSESAQEPFAGTLAADESVVQCFDGVECSAAIWCAEEGAHMKLREFKHSYTDRDRVITLLLLEGAEPRSWDRSWQDENSFDCSDQFASNGHPTTSER
ncbi:MAG: ImmA/IrrE family metallo-endopeptidase [Rhodanobacteraceae bacterium]|nr:ImmA/IrrE family metallo-endopeptidase [Rhodanobacteraceae bacterium]MBL0041162.1 ImmA/IrrE family metallo-endopeptidase [Xanthomonadales bacterium]